MKFYGIKKTFSLLNEDQYNTIGAFWDEISDIYGLENLQGLGLNWRNGYMDYVIGLKNGIIPNANFVVELPDNDWISYIGETDKLKEIYDLIYKDGPLLYEIESFNEDGSCKILYYRYFKRVEFPTLIFWFNKLNVGFCFTSRNCWDLKTQHFVDCFKVLFK